MRVAILGGTGFVGSYLVDELIARAHEPVLLVRRGSEAKVRQAERCRVVSGDVGDAAAIDAVLEDADAVIYNVGILRESAANGVSFEALHFTGVERTLAAALRAGVTRFLLMSANGILPHGTPYETTKLRAEDAVRGSGMDYTIFRPSVIFGDPRGRDEIATRLHREMIVPPLPAVYFHTGWRPDPESIRLSPVHVADVATAFVAALDAPAANNRILALGGPETLSWKRLLERIADATGHQKLFLPMPIGLMIAAATALDRFEAFPATRDQLRMLSRGNVAGSEALAGLIGRAPTAFTLPALAYLGST